MVMLDKIPIWFFIAILVDSLLGETFRNDSNWEKIIPIIISLGIAGFPYFIYIFFKKFIKLDSFLSYG